MIHRAEMLKLVDAHRAIEDEPLAAAIWIRRNASEGWLVEMLPSLPGGDHPEAPVSFNASRTFRHALHLIASDREGLERAVRADPELAEAIADGDLLWEDDQRAGSSLKAFAAEVVRGHARAG